jgi:hypothetical protein
MTFHDDRISALFFEALSKGNVKSIVNTAYDIFGCPILLTDENYHLLYCYPPKRIGLEIWDDLFEHGSLKEETIWKYQKSYLLNQELIYEPFYSDEGPAQDAPRIFGEIFTSQRQILGHIAIFLMDRKLQEKDLAITKVFTEALRIQMSQYSYSHAINFNYLLDLLTPETSWHRKIIANEALAERIKGNFCVSATLIGTTAAQIAYASTAIHYLNSSYRNTLSTQYNGCIVSLFGEITDREAISAKELTFLKSAARFLQHSYQYIGVSMPFDNLMKADIYYKQAYLTAQLHLPNVAYFSECTPSQIFLPALEYAGPEVYIHPVLQKILIYDAKNNTDYYETLRRYSLNLYDRESTARELHIHRNTLLYRLNRITELFDLSFEDKRTALHLLNSFQLADLQKHDEN